MDYDNDDDRFDDRRKRDKDRFEVPTYFLRSYEPYREHYASTNLNRVRAFQVMFPGSMIEESFSPQRR